MKALPRSAPFHGRRRLLKMLAASLACGSGGATALARGAAPSPTHEQLQRAIPVSGERLPVVGLGTARTFDVGMAVEGRRPLRDVMRAFVDEGGAAVDTSPMYGSAESVLGRLVVETGVSGSIFFATKVWTEGRDEGVRQMEQSVRRLETNVIDLMQVHNLVDTATHLKTIREWISRGRIRYLGVTHYTTSAFGELERWMRRERPDFVQFPYSIANRAAEDRLLDVAAQHGVATIAHRNFERGQLFQRVRGRPLPGWAAEFDCVSWGNFFLKYLVADPRLTCVIPATSRRAHLLDNMNAGRGRLPDARQRRRMARLIDSL